MRIAYADPPYIGQAKKHYGPDAKEVNHRTLIGHLEEFDGWALSCSSPSLREILPLCPDDVRIGAWVKPFCAFKKGVRPAYAWEPVIYKGGRNQAPAYSQGRPANHAKGFCVGQHRLEKGTGGRQAPRVLSVDFCTS